VIQARNGQQAVEVALVDRHSAVLDGPDFVSVCRSDPASAKSP
jgi:hypothetical protein